MIYWNSKVEGGENMKEMKKDNGFTLIELLAVIVILAIIAVIATPLTINVINDARERSFINSVYGLIDGARLLSAEQVFDDGSNEVVVNFTDGTADNTNFKVSGDMPNSGTIHLNSDGKVELKVWSEELGKCAEKGVNEAEVRITDTVKELCVIDNVTLPIITLNGDSTMTITEGETFTDPGYTATYRGVDITSNVTVQGTVNTSVVDTYTLTYTVSYNGKDATPVERIVNVEKLCPTVTVMGKSIQTCDTATLDPDGNLRYVGPTPNNYVSFNNELWRIIGVFNGQTKIIRDEYYSTSIPWDEDDGSYLNNWATASLQLELNNTTDGYIKTIETNDPTSYGYIDLEHVWNIGGHDRTYKTTGTRSAFYIAERSNTPAGASGSEATWTGAIGLMYPSDYGYASSGASETCDSTVMYDWETAPAFAECVQKSWLDDQYHYQWTLTPLSGGSSLAFYVDNIGRVFGNYGVSRSLAARPVLYLKSDTKIVGGHGTDQQPFILGK